MAWHDANIEPVEPAAVFNHDVITDAKPSCLGKGRVDTVAPMPAAREASTGGAGEIRTRPTGDAREYAAAHLVV